jgi:hypothetical protein
VRFGGSDPAQRAVELDAVAAAPDESVELGTNFIATGHRATLAITWPPAEVAKATWTRYGSNGTLTLVAAGATLRTTYALSSLTAPAAITAFAQAERDWLAANPNPP